MKEMICPCVLILSLVINVYFLSFCINIWQQYIHTFLHTYILTYIHSYIHTYIHTYMYIYIYNIDCLLSLDKRNDH